MTAHHAIAAILDSNDNLTAYKLRFPQGWRFDYDNPGNYVDSNGDRLLAKDYFHNDSWYLRYRLKSLGLDEDAMRDFDQYGEFLLFSTYKTWDIVESFSHWADANGYRDIAAIQTEPKDITHFTELLAWKAIGPGVFHDYRKPKAYREALNEGDPGLPRDPASGDSLAGFFVHFPLRPAADPPLDYRESLVGRDAIVRSVVEEKPCKNATTGDPEYCDELYGHYVRTNLEWELA